MAMTKIDIADLIESEGYPSSPIQIKAIKSSLGKEIYQQYQQALLADVPSQALIKLGKELEKRKVLNFGFAKIYKPLLCYALAAKLKNINAYKAIRLAVKKQLFHQELYDPRLVDLLELSNRKMQELKSYLNDSIMPDDVKDKNLRLLLKKVNTLDNMVLAERLDIAFEIYKSCHELLKSHLERENHHEIEKAKKTAVKFMEIILDVEGEAKILRKMNTRIAKKLLDSEFIPGKKPKKMTKLPDRHESKSKAQYQWRRLSELALGHSHGKILAVKEQAKEKDSSEGTRFLTPEERDEHRVIIRQGKFYERQHNNEYVTCDTSGRISHEKIAYAAYTINLQGEISLFDHFEIADLYAHSSMNAQAPLFAAGEIQVINGEFKALTVYSRHYNPTLLNVHEVLSYFQEHGVDISNAIVRTWGANNEFTANKFINYNASEFYENFKVSGLSAIKPINMPTILPSENSTTPVFDDFEPNFPQENEVAFFGDKKSETTITSIPQADTAKTIGESFSDFEVDFENNLPTVTENMQAQTQKHKK